METPSTSDQANTQQQKKKAAEEEEAPGTLLERILAYIKQNPFMMVILSYSIMKRFRGTPPWPEVGGNITKVHSLAEWEDLVSECKSAKRALVVDGYALWCGPCKNCADPYARLSEELSSTTCCFAKFDVDEAGGLAKKLGVSSMPCFIVYKDGKEVERQTGFPGKDGLKKLLMKHGALEAADEDDDEPRIVDVTEESGKNR